MRSKSHHILRLPGGKSCVMLERDPHMLSGLVHRESLTNA